MNKVIKKQLNKIEKQDEKYLRVKKENKLQKKTKELSDSLEQKIPLKLRETIENAFYKAFLMIFEKGTGIIEKTYDKQKIMWEHQFQNYRFQETKSKKEFKKIEKEIRRNHRKNIAVTAVEGAGLGILGIGLPDIPIFLGIILKGIYETALRYGYDYSDKKEQIYILQLIRGAMVEQQQKMEMDVLVEKTAENIEKGMILNCDWEEEVVKTSKVLSDALLVAKFVQGLPLIGVAGSGYNVMVYHKILKYCNRKYQKRYLKKCSS